MRYAIAIEPGDKRHAFGVAVPDLPGCFSAGDTIDDAIDNAREAILLHIEGLLDAGALVPEAQPLSVHQKNPDYHGWTWAFVNVDLTALDDRTLRVNVTIPARVLHRVDAAAKRVGESRSGYLVQAALAQMERESERAKRKA